LCFFFTGDSSTIEIPFFSLFFTYKGDVGGEEEEEEGDGNKINKSGWEKKITPMVTCLSPLKNDQRK